jgi:hypothetical protein
LIQRFNTTADKHFENTSLGGMPPLFKIQSSTGKQFTQLKQTISAKD